MFTVFGGTIVLYFIKILSGSRNLNQLDLVAQLVEHWTSKIKVAGLIPTRVKQFFSLSSVDTFRVTLHNKNLK